MDPRFGHDQTRTLGAYVQSLRPGCACACCGGALREPEVSAKPGAARVALAPGSSGSAVAMCPHCGCEVTELAEEEAAAVAA